MDEKTRVMFEGGGGGKGGALSNRGNNLGKSGPVFSVINLAQLPEKSHHCRGTCACLSVPLAN